MQLFIYTILITILCNTVQSSINYYNKKIDFWRSTENSFEEDKLNANKNIWVVLVAGSNGFINYRHQADVCHAFHLLRGHGVPASQIITMMYDDIAYNELNPYPGKIFNEPHGNDVYKGVKIDYKGDDVTPENFMAILRGDKSAVKGGNGRVLESYGKKVFVYFSDHGGSGMILFPKSILTANNLKETLNEMHKKKLYSELTFYLEACESGSMFSGVLSDSINVYAVTAANTVESSFGCYCETDLDLPCLGDLFSVNWMFDTEKQNVKKESLETQYFNVKKSTNLSHVCHFGDETIWLEHVSEFQGESQKPIRQLYSVEENQVHKYKMWPSRDIPLLELQRRIHKANNENNEKEYQNLNAKLNNLKEKRLFLKNKILGLVETIIHDENNRERVFKSYPQKLKDYLDCHHTVVHVFHRECFNLNENPYALKYIYVLANLCEMNIKTDRLVVLIRDYCIPEIIEKVTGIL